MTLLKEVSFSKLELILGFTGVFFTGIVFAGFIY